jgi:hypothetical protein
MSDLVLDCIAIGCSSAALGMQVGLMLASRNTDEWRRAAEMWKRLALARPGEHDLSASYRNTPTK